jgi:hypothetical protein
MALQILIHYKDHPVAFNVKTQESDIYHLSRDQKENHINGEYIPEKIIIRKKGKIWISDIETYPELIGKLTTEVIKFNRDVY